MRELGLLGLAHGGVGVVQALDPEVRNKFADFLIREAYITHHIIHNLISDGSMQLALANRHCSRYSKSWSPEYSSETYMRF